MHKMVLKMTNDQFPL